MSNIDESDNPYEFTNLKTELHYWEEIAFDGKHYSDVTEEELKNLAEEEEETPIVGESQVDEEDHAFEQCDEVDADEDLGADLGQPDYRGPFETFEKARDALKLFTNCKYVHLSTRRSDKDPETNTLKYAHYLCDRGGAPQPRQFVSKLEKGSRNSRSKKIHCPFNATIGREKNQYYITIGDTKHNHTPTKAEFESSTRYRKLTEEQKKTISVLRRAGVKPRKMIAALQRENPDMIITARAVYNAISACKAKELNGRLPVQALADLLATKEEYTYEVKINAENGKCEGLFFTHKNAVLLYEKFSTVLVIDATYKTNKFKMPLVQVAGMTHCNKTFILGNAFIKNETTEDYRWVLTQVQKFCLGCADEPKVICTDRELALMSAIEEEFPEATNFLCRWHIMKNVLSNIKVHFPGLYAEKVLSLLKSWNKLVDSPVTEKDYNDLYGKFISELPNKTYNPATFIKYLNDTWVPHKERFVSAWTNKHTHFNSTSSSRIEGAHAAMKKQIETSTGDLHYVFGAMDIVLSQQLNNLNIELMTDRTKQSNAFRTIDLFNKVNSQISAYALTKVFQKYALVQVNNIKKTKTNRPCCKYLTTTMGIPCSHVIDQVMQSKTPFLQKHHFHQQWWLKNHTVVNEAILLEVPKKYPDAPTPAEELFECENMTPVEQAAFDAKQEATYYSQCFEIDNYNKNLKRKQNAYRARIAKKNNESNSKKNEKTEENSPKKTEKTEENVDQKNKKTEESNCQKNEKKEENTHQKNEYTEENNHKNNEKTEESNHKNNEENEETHENINKNNEKTQENSNQKNEETKENIQETQDTTFHQKDATTSDNEADDNDIVFDDDNLFSTHNFDLFKKRYESLPNHQKLVAKQVFKNLCDGILPFQLEEPDKCRSKGRPVTNKSQKSSTQRNPSRHEYVEKEINKDLRKKRKTDQKPNQKQYKRQKTQQKNDIIQQTNQKNDINQQTNKKTDINLETSTKEKQNEPEISKDILEKYGRFNIPKHLLVSISLLTDPKLQYDTIAEYIEPIKVPKGLGDHFSGRYNPKGDGNCGYRAVSRGIYGTEDLWQEVKNVMKNHLLKNEKFYKSHVMGNTNDLQRGSFNWLLNLLSSDASVGGATFWFTFPDCVRLAADAFNTAISCYHHNGFQDCTFLPFTDDDHLETHIHLQLYHQHYYTVFVDNPESVYFPPVYVGYESICERSGKKNLSHLLKFYEV